MYDETVQIGACCMQCFLKQGLQQDIASTNKYVDSGIMHLYRVLCRHGAGIGRIKAKIIGGARMFEFNMPYKSADIGTLNVKTRQNNTFYGLGVPLTAEMTGGVTGRTVYFTAGTGEVK